MGGQSIGIASALMVLLGATQDGGVIVPAFVTKAIAQSTPVASSQNTLTLTMQTSINLKDTDGATVIISGFVGAVVSGTTVSLSGGDAVVFCNQSGTPPTHATAAWNAVTAAFELHICTGEIMLPLTDYVLSLTITNPAAAQPSPNISISGTGGVQIPE
eukprot:827053-Rhodomonas_salina.1